jgi:hypothetical protein
MALKEVTSVLGYAQYTTTGSAFTLNTAPDTGGTFNSQAADNNGQQPNAVLMQAEAQNLRWRGDDVAPTTTVGNILYAGTTLLYDGPLNRIRFIAATGGGILNVQYLYGGAG